jgi:hypothetical protein
VPLISDGSNYKVMKGDLLVVQSKRINSNIQSIWGISKDTWIISDSLQELQSHKNSSNIVLKLKNQSSFYKYGFDK